MNTVWPHIYYLHSIHLFLRTCYGNENDCLHTLRLCNLTQEVICTLSTVLTPVTGSEYFKSLQKPKSLFIKLAVFLAFKDIQQFDWNCFRRKKPEGDFFVSEWWMLLANMWKCNMTIICISKSDITIHSWQPLRLSRDFTLLVTLLV